MRRIQEKVKDLVEVRSYKSLRDFISDPSQTLAAYHFTDVTAEMMAKWLNSVSEVQPQYGMAKALAGYRGVGKSHFLATLGAVVSNPELRSRITEPYVAASAQRLKRRRHPVAHVRRGTHETLLDELKDAIAGTFDVSPKELGNSLIEILESAADRSGDLPFVLLIDTAHDRAARVARDDGVLLGEIAEIAKRKNIFVGVALDDDITGADGINAAIARNYTIDYLDQEHLYRIVETEIFPKQRQTQHLIHELYSGFREVIPGFRWSEQRFTSLYPLHPVILETAPYIRLYAPEFAMLGFASEAGAKVLGRPANSLVALDEVFDRVEPSLRKAKDLQEAFAAYDFLNAEVVSLIPVMERLQAKLILKALMILSLDGEGATAAEIGAAMLIYNENDVQSGIQTVENLLETFVSVSPDKVNRFAQENRETRFGLKVSGKDDLNKTLAELTKELPPAAVEKVLRRHARERFTDWILQAESETSSTDTVDCQVIWRGGYRRGRIAWNWERRGGANALLNPEAAEFLDWEIIVCHPQNKDAANLSQSDLPLVIWQPAPLRQDEEATILRYSVLLTNEDLREDYGEQVRAAGHTHQLAVEKIWNRIFIEEGKLLIDGFQHSFNETAKSAQTLCEMLSQMLTPLFELRYPQHPFFDRPLGMSDVAHLVSEHFSGAKQTLPEVQEIAQAFALPLGLVTKQGNNYILESDEMLMRLPIARQIMSFVGQNPKETVPLKAVYNSLRREPNGLLREAQHLVLAALVAQRKIEFITAKGDRINRRSLDLKIIWDDIIGISSPLTHFYASNILTDWAKVLTGNNSFRTIDDPADCEKINLALENWLSEWKKVRLLERFEELSDDILTTKIWRISTTVQKTFGMIAASVESMLEGGISLEECLQRVVDAFSDSREEFLICSNKVTMLEDFVNAVVLRKKVWSYMAICESSHDENIEGLHTTLLELVEKLTENPRASINRELETLWHSFHEKFSEHFAIKHDTVMKSHHLQEKFDEIMRGDEWWEFENLSGLSIFQQKHWQEARKLHRQFRELDCRFNVREMLETHPFCACSFRLSQVSEWEKLPERLRKTVEEGRKSYRKTISLMSNILIPNLRDHARKEQLVEYSEAAANLANLLESGQELRLLNNAELIVLGKVFQTIPSAPPLQVALPTDENFVSREDLRAKLTEWLDKLPDEPYLLKI